MPSRNSEAPAWVLMPACSSRSQRASVTGSNSPISSTGSSALIFFQEVATARLSEPKSNPICFSAASRCGT